MQRKAQWWQHQAERQARELQALVWPNGAPRGQRSAAQTLYPNHSSEFREVVIARRDTTAPKPNTTAEIIYPNLPRSK